MLLFHNMCGKRLGALWMLLVLACESHALGDIAKCEKVAAGAAWRDHNTIVETSLETLAGTWISQGCETRPGPEYVLRSYSFTAEGNYFLVQHHYWDDSCSSPKLTLTAHGRISLRNSMEQLEASNGLAKHINATVTPYDAAAAEELNNVVATECPGQYWKSWKRNEEHLVHDNRQERRGTFNLWSQSFLPIAKTLPSSNAGPLAGSLSCLGSLKWAFNELKLLKVQLRPSVEHRKHPRQVEMELLLGDIHTNKKRREFYTPTSFQTPLVKQTKGENITIGRRQFIVKTVNNFFTNMLSNVKSPPHLTEKPHLPPYIWGEWSSTRCESRPMDIYLMRHFSFYEEDFGWVGEHKFFSDPFCTYPKFVVTAMGHFGMVGASEEMTGVSDIDLHIQRASMTVLEHNAISEMRLQGFCGLGEWRVNVPKELATTNGCISLGIFIPSIRYDIVKVEMDYQGSWLLFMGQSDTSNFAATDNERPTAFQLPLVKCGEEEEFRDSLRGRLQSRFYFGGGVTLRVTHFVLLLSALAFCIWS